MAYQVIKDVQYVDTEINEIIYRVYRNGSVLSLASNKTVKQRLDKDGYSCFTAGKKHHRTCVLTHRIVGNLFLEKPIDAEEVKYEINHIDTDRTNPSVENLTFMTHRENIRHSANIGNYKGKDGENNTNAKLTREDVVEIRTLLGNGVSVADIAKMFGRGWQTINHVKRGTTWADVVID